MKENFIKSLNQLIYDIDPYDDSDNYGSLEEGLNALRDVLNDYDTMKAILSFVYAVMNELPEAITTEKERSVVKKLVRHVASIKG